MKQIPLTKGKVALVDDADYDYLKQWKWHCTSDVHGYAARRARKKDGGRILLMHRVILNAPPGSYVDHRNSNGLDNQRGNIRVCSPSQNRMNTRRPVGCVTQYKGVSFHKTSGLWHASLTINYKRIALGYWPTEIEAARAYDQKARELFGDFARLNFPDETTLPTKPIRVISSSYRGVFKERPNTWRAAIQHRKKQIRLGRFRSEEEAARAYDAKAVELHGVRAKLNFPLEREGL